MVKRRYSDEERAQALAALVANGNNVSGTAKRLGIPPDTLRHWALGQRHPEAGKMAEDKKAPLADLFELFVSRVLSLTTDADIQGATLRDRFTAAGIAIDKARLLRGEPTAIDEHRGTVTSRIADLNAAFAGVANRSGEGGVPGDGSGEPVDPPGSPGGPDSEADRVPVL